MIEVAKLGKTVGLKGFLKLHFLTDFPEQFQKGSVYHTKIGDLTIEALNGKGDVKFVGYDTKEDAATLTNLVLKSTIEESDRACELDDDEYFWYDIIGLEVWEDDTQIGTVREIERYPTEDHLLIDTAETIQESKKLKRFLLPFNGRTVDRVDLEGKKITVKGALEIIDVIAS